MSRHTLRKIFSLIAAFMFGLVAYFAFLTYRQVQRATMHSQVAVLGATLAKFLEEGHKPAEVPGYMSKLDSQRLIERDDEGRLLDPWGKALEVEVDHMEDSYRVTVTSRGRDRTLGTPDDYSRTFDVETTLATGNPSNQSARQSAISREPENAGD